jgi:hypothetical protein
MSAAFKIAAMNACLWAALIQAYRMDGWRGVVVIFAMIAAATIAFTFLFAFIQEVRRK